MHLRIADIIKSVMALAKNKHNYTPTYISLLFRCLFFMSSLMTLLVLYLSTVGKCDGTPMKLRSNMGI